MPVDKQQNGKPVAPHLSANLRHARSSLTPRLAGSAPQSPASAQRPNPFARSRSPERDATKPIPLLDGNITPRSAARKTRLGTESPATPGSLRDANLSRPRTKSNAATTTSPHTSAGLGISGPSSTVTELAKSQESAKLPSPVYSVARRLSGARSTICDGEDSNGKFFRADAAKSYASLPGTTEKSQTSRHGGQAFFVGGEQPLTSPKPLASSDTQMDEKFFHASDVRSKPARASPRLTAHARSVDSAPMKAMSRPGNQIGSGASLSRPNSPVKSAVRTSQNSGSPQPRSPQKAGFASDQPSVPASIAVRRTSVGSHLSSSRTNQSPGHQKSMSTSSINGAPERKGSPPRPTIDSPAAARHDGFSGQTLSRFAQQNALLLSPESISPRSTSLTSSNTAGTSLTSEEERQEELNLRNFQSVGALFTSFISPRLDPAKDSLGEVPRPINDEASNARRERKVLDLEISNSSLLAINKTLERELKKQSGELRRFRRLSRSGRLSLAPTERTASGSTLDTVNELNDEDASDSEQGNDSDHDTDEDDVLSNDSSSIQSPTSNSRQRARDEKRLMLDLSKHRQMLLDSQKLTQSIRRCLTCTEELIHDGNKAIDYRVGIGDVKLGGRVLTIDDTSHTGSGDDEDPFPQRQGLLSPSIKRANLTDADLWTTGNESNSITSNPELDCESNPKDGVLSPSVERLFEQLLQV